MILTTRLLTERCRLLLEETCCVPKSEIIRWCLREYAAVDSWFGSCPCFWYFGICTLLVFPTYVCSKPALTAYRSLRLRPQWVAADMTAHIQCTSLRLCLYHVVAASVCLGIVCSQIRSCRVSLGEARLVRTVRRYIQLHEASPSSVLHSTHTPRHRRTILQTPSP
jgi:hypothetical protein